jgi:hypothetical protein
VGLRLSGFGREKCVGSVSEGAIWGSGPGVVVVSRTSEDDPIAPVHTAKQGWDRNLNTSVICEGPGPLDIVTKCREVDKRFGAQEAGSDVRLEGDELRTWITRGFRIWSLGGRLRAEA